MVKFWPIFLHLFTYGFSHDRTISLGTLTNGAKTFATSAVEKAGEVIKKIEPLDNILNADCVEPPKECPNSNITFWYTPRHNLNDQKKISVSDPSSFMFLPRDDIPWKIIIHGYTKSKDETPNPELKQAYSKRGHYNLISVDYAPIAREKCYIQAVHNVPLISNCTAQFIDALVDKNIVNISNLHVIGFSLGAQVSGKLHEFLKSGKPGRVTGLDPASPLFDGFIHTKLDNESADFVDVIHTNALAKGQLERSGHIDFYVNGGINQPGCMSVSVGNASSCSHNRSPKYFAESINSKDGFWGIPCTNYLKFYGGLCNTDESNLVIMGEYVPKDARGVYYLETTDSPPYALGKRSKIRKLTKILFS